MRVRLVKLQWPRTCVALVAAGLAGCASRPVLTADDVIAFDGQQARFAASVYHDYGASFHSDINGTEVEFKVNGQVVARGVTNRDGRVFATGRVDPNIRTFEASTRVKSKAVKTVGAVYRWSAERTVIAVDIDETISATRYSDLFIADFDGSRPIPGAREVLWKLSRDFDLLYISARPDFLQEKTRAWLQHHGFPPAPYMGADKFAACLDQAGYKRRMLAELRSRWPNVLVGIGDKKVDDAAYGDNGMLALIVNGAPLGTFTQRCLMMTDWAALQGFFRAHEERLTNPRQLAGLIRENGDQLRVAFAPAREPRQPAPRAEQPAQAAVRAEATRRDSQAVVQRPTEHEPSF